MKTKFEVKKYIRKAPKWTGQKYELKIGGLQLFFKTLKETEEYYQQYVK